MPGKLTVTGDSFYSLEIPDKSEIILGTSSANETRIVKYLRYLQSNLHPICFGYVSCQNGLRVMNIVRKLICDSSQTLNPSFDEHCGRGELPSTGIRSQCCDYNLRAERCSTPISGRHIGKPKPESSSGPEPNLQVLDKSPLKNALKVIESLADEDLSLLQAYLIVYPSQINALLPFRPQYALDFTVSHYSLLQIAILKDNPRAVNLILNFEPDIEIKPSPLLLACHRLDMLGHSFNPEYRRCHGNKLHDIIRNLLEHGANPNTHHRESVGKDKIAFHTPLTCSVHSESIEAVQLLLSHGARPVPDVRKEKQSAKILQQICRTYLGFGLSFLRVLLPRLIENGFDINAYYGDLQLIHIECSSGYYKEKLELLIEHGADINAKDRTGSFTALHLILTVDNQQITETLVEELMSLRADFSIKAKVPGKSVSELPSRLCHLVKEKKSCTGVDMLPNNFPRDMSFYRIDDEEQITAEPAKTADRVPGANKVPPAADQTPSLFWKFVSCLSVATCSRQRRPGWQRDPAPSYALGSVNASCQEQDVSSQHQLFNPDAAISGVFREEPPPSYNSLFGEESEKSFSPSQEKS